MSASIWNPSGNLPAGYMVQKNYPNTIPRTLQAALDSSFVSAKDFGAVGDGIIDDTQAIQNALNSGRPVYLPNGTYKISQLFYTANNQALVGESSAATILASTLTSPGSSVISNSTANTVTKLFCSLKNLQVLASGLATGYVVDWKSFQFGRIEDVWAYGGGANCTGIRLDAVWNITECTYNNVQNCYVGNVTKGISFGDGANTNTCINNRLQPNPGGYGYFALGTATYRVSNNTIVGGGVEYVGAVSRGIYAGLGVDVLTVVGVRFEYLAVAIETTVDANGVMLLGNYYDSNTVDYAMAGTNEIRLEEGGLIVSNAAVTSTTCLDYYRRGTFTPAIIGTSAAGVGTYTTQSGSYTRVGNRVDFELEITWTAHTGTGNIQISGLPFTVKNQTHLNAFAVVASDLTFSGQLVATGVVNDTKINLRSMASGAALTAVAIDAAATLIISGSYSV